MPRGRSAGAKHEDRRLRADPGGRRLLDLLSSHEGTTFSRHISARCVSRLSLLFRDFWSEFWWDWNQVKYNKKPTYDSLRRSLIAMKSHMLSHVNPQAICRCM